MLVPADENEEEEWVAFLRTNLSFPARVGISLWLEVLSAWVARNDNLPAEDTLSSKALLAS